MTSEQSDIRAYLEVLWRWKILILAIVVIIPAAVYAYVSNQPKVFESSVLLQVQPLAVDTSLFSTQVAAPQAQTLRSAARLITTTGVAEAAAEELGEPASSARALLATITATPDVEADFISVAAQGPTAERAAAVANAFAAAVVTTRRNLAVGRVNGAIRNISDQLDRLALGDRDGRRQLSEQLQRLRAARSAGQQRQDRGARSLVRKPGRAEGHSDRGTRRHCRSPARVRRRSVGPGADRRIRDPLELEAITSHCC